MLGCCLQMCHFLIHIIVRHDRLGSLTILKALLCPTMTTLEGGGASEISGESPPPHQTKMIKILSFLPDLLNPDAGGGTGLG